MGSPIKPALDLVQFNHFLKSDSTKTGYLLNAGKAIYSEKVYLILPHYIHKRSPAFSLVKPPGQHVSGFFPTGVQDWYYGDDRKNGLLIYLRENDFELWRTMMSPSKMKERFMSGQLSGSLSKARKDTFQTR